MLMRISLIVAIIGGLAVGGLNFFQIKTKIEETTKQRDDFRTQREEEKAAKVKAQKLADDTKIKLDDTTKQLTATRQERDAAVTKADEQTKKATELDANLKKTQGDLESARNTVARWEGLMVPIEKMRETLASIKQFKEQAEAVQSENGVLNAKVVKLQATIKEMKGTQADPPMPVDMAGKVIAVDPRFEFVVVNVGGKAGAVKNGKLLVHRNGKLVGKLRITESIQNDRCIADIMEVPGFQTSMIMEGDDVIPKDIE